MESWKKNEDWLIARAQQGEAAAFEALVELHGPLVYNLALRMLKDAQEAEDLAQEAFLRAWRGLPNFQRRAKFSTWLYRIVANLCYSRLPGLHQELASLAPEAEASDVPDQHQSIDRFIVFEELKILLQNAIEDLPDHYRMLINLRHLQGMSYDEIAHATGMPLGTVKTGIFRARSILRQALIAEGVHDG